MPPTKLEHTSLVTKGTAGDAPRPRLLYVINEAYFFVSHRIPVARAAQEAGFEVHVAAPAHHDWAPKGFDVADLSALGFRFHPVPLSRRGTNPIQEVRTFLALIALLRAVRPAIVHFITVKPNLYGGVAARITRVPAAVFAVTGLGHLFVSSAVSVRFLRGIVAGLMRVAFGHRNSTIIFQNPDDREQLVRLGVAPPARSVVILGSGVDLRRFTVQREPAGIPVVVLCARLIWEKGIAEFVAAARTIKASGVPARFVLVGETRPSNPRSVPRETLEGWSREGAVEWWGYRTDMDTVLSSSSIVCLPSSYGEGVPKILLEAAAVGRPIVATDIPGCREAVRHGLTGFLTAPADQDALVVAIQKLLEDPGLRAQMGRAGRLLAEKAFDDQSIGRQTLRVYEGLGAGGP